MEVTMSDEITINWEGKISEKLVGRTIVKVEYLTQEETDKNYWYKRPIALVLDDGNWLIPMADDEGNDGGSIATSFKELGTIPVM